MLRRGWVLLSMAAAVRFVLQVEFRRVPDVARRWRWSRGPMRTLTITIVAFNVTFGAAWAVPVLWALDRLGMRDVGFGLLTA